MKLSNAQVDPEKIEQGDWVGEKYGTPVPEMGDLCLRVRGVNNADWRKLQARLFDGVPRNERLSGRISPAEQDRITMMCLLDAGLLDWENVEGDGVIGEVGQSVPFDKKTAARLLSDPVYRHFRDAAIWAANIVGEQVKQDQGKISGN